MSESASPTTSLIHIVRRGSVSAVLKELAQLRRDDSRHLVDLLLDRCGVSATAEDERGQTALHYLVQGDSIECVEVLLQRGCVLDHADRLMLHTPLFYAARYGSACMLKRLGQLKANANLRDSNGQTPLFWTTCLENCRALVEHCGAYINVPDAQSVGPVDFFKQSKLKQAGRIARYLAMCGEIRQMKHRHVWVIREDVVDLASSGSSTSDFSAYATALAGKPDVPQLCALEDDFVRDHQVIFGSAVSTMEEVMSQVGVHADPDARRATIKSIVQSPPVSGKVRHYTLLCVHIGPTSETPPPEGARAVRTRGNASRARACQVIGYVYFRLCHGPYQPETEDGPPPGPTSPAQGYMVISHLKVDSRHQKRGVATMMLAGALHFANAEKAGFCCKDVYLSVVSTNTPATRLYEKLGFVECGRESGAVEWHNLHLALNGATPAEQAVRLLAHVPGASLAPLERLSGWGGLRRAQKEAQAELLARPAPSPSEKRSAKRPKAAPEASPNSTSAGSTRLLSSTT